MSEAGCWAWVRPLDRLLASEMGELFPYPAEPSWGVL